MKFEALEIVNKNNEKVKKQLEKKLVNRIKKLFKKQKILKTQTGAKVYKTQNKIFQEAIMKLLKLLNHSLTKSQEKELKEVWGVTEIVTLSPENIKKFGQVTKKSYRDVIDSINAEIRQIKPDLMFIQGQAGVVHNVINANSNVTPLFAMTERKSVETQNTDGTITKTNVFEHQCFMKY